MTYVQVTQHSVTFHERRPDTAHEAPIVELHADVVASQAAIDQGLDDADFGVALHEREQAADGYFDRHYLALIRIHSTDALDGLIAALQSVRRDMGDRP